MKILLIGANGQLGRALWKVLKESSHELVCTGRWDRESGVPDSFLIKNLEYLDITDGDMVDEVIGRIRPDVAINCAAHTEVDLCEEQEELARKINAEGPFNLARSLQKIGGTLVHISTDYVFNGKADKPYVEEDKPDPVAVYGKTKYQGEKAVMENISKYFIIRTAWLYGDGKNFVKTMLRLSKEHKELKVVNDQKGSPTSASELAKMIVNLIGTSSYGIYHGTCEGETTWFDFAKTIFELSDIQCAVLPVTTEEYAAKAQRPRYSVLENKRYNLMGFPKFKHWREALCEYLGELGKL